VNGVLAPYAQSAPFVAAAQELAADAGLRARLRTGAAETARSLTWDRVVDDLEAIFRALVDQARASRAAAKGGTRASGPVVKPGVDHAPL
jgi:hypothetical protein